mmetsp:Transcript_38984/g.86738  ORF Transcript_38984/g.86738 Transcript_38984/m.86738 type:complete len:724 (+) Transcript_38984:174-2345(+)|eukprot:CAMPEP_0202922582 /NCGR_PEP_ID=MMETSP1392-20130828/77997_1 /ASSEMBLY_ACC=CAM_ASM_000868 /TAXON_ID=225041 /ORGANISM="Chlamydomonas chlamydogama, Strain SAG 11-48b" /LENGTH=723 /DNA_ID=CAMNT_0049616213 /DNA_START=163 /DNA_END=2334 /DNA_ORIENTATION=+
MECIDNHGDKAQSSHEMPHSAFDVVTEEGWKYLDKEDICNLRCVCTEMLMQSYFMMRELKVTGPTTRGIFGNATASQPTANSPRLILQAETADRFTTIFKKLSRLEHLQLLDLDQQACDLVVSMLRDLRASGPHHGANISVLTWNSSCSPKELHLGLRTADIIAAAVPQLFPNLRHVKVKATNPMHGPPLGSHNSLMTWQQLQRLRSLELSMVTLKGGSLQFMSLLTGLTRLAACSDDWTSQDPHHPPYTFYQSLLSCLPHLPALSSLELGGFVHLGDAVSPGLQALTQLTQLHFWAFHTSQHLTFDHSPAEDDVCRDANLAVMRLCGLLPGIRDLALPHMWLLPDSLQALTLLTRLTRLAAGTVWLPSPPEPAAPPAPQAPPSLQVLQLSCATAPCHLLRWLANPGQLQRLDCAEAAWPGMCDDTRKNFLEVNLEGCTLNYPDAAEPLQLVADDLQALLQWPLLQRRLAATGSVYLTGGGMLGRDPLLHVVMRALAPAGSHLRRVWLQYLDLRYTDLQALAEACPLLTELYLDHCDLGSSDIPIMDIFGEMQHHGLPEQGGPEVAVQQQQQQEEEQEEQQQQQQEELGAQEVVLAAAGLGEVAPAGAALMHGLGIDPDGGDVRPALGALLALPHLDTLLLHWNSHYSWLRHTPDIVALCRGVQRPLKLVCQPSMDEEENASWDAAGWIGEMLGGGVPLVSIVAKLRLLCYAESVCQTAGGGL